MSNNLDKLNSILFKSLDSLDDDKASDKQLNSRIDRAKTVTHLAKQIIDNAKVQLEAQKLYNPTGLSNIDKPDLFSIEHKDA